VSSAQSRLQLIEQRLRLAVSQGKLCTICVTDALAILRAGRFDPKDPVRDCAKCPTLRLWNEIRELLSHEEDPVPASPLPKPTNMTLSSPKLRALEARLDKATAQSETQHRSNKVAIGKLKNTIVRGAFKEEDLEATSELSAPINGAPEPEQAPKATMIFDSKKYAEESKLFKVRGMNFDDGVEGGASE